MREIFVLRRLAGRIACAVLGLVLAFGVAIDVGGCSDGGAAPEATCYELGECAQVGVGGQGGAPLVECKQKADCAQPDPKCGSVTCISGVCVRSIDVGPTPSQLRGDCLRTDCDETGHVVTVPDETDAYDDGRVCTIDKCTAEGSVNEELPLDTKCPGQEGVCVNKWCLPCMSDWVCQTPTFTCSSAHKCVPNKCYSNKKEPPETDVDCGGPCGPCESGMGCTVNSECISALCKDQKCTTPTCDDGVQNGAEVGVDCGPPMCDPCADGRGCELPSDCVSGVCWGGTCQVPTCFDGVKNGSEAGVDCDGSCGACL
jgi:hypothetical protein